MDKETLGLFPWFGQESIGGVQLSGRLAWEAIAHHFRGARLLSFGAPADGTSPRLPSEVAASSKGRALLAALRHPWRAEQVVIWHTGLLKLLPFLRLSRARVILFLHGIEGWRPLDPLTRLLLRRVDLFLSNSDHTWERFLDFHPTVARKPHRTVHLGVAEPLAAPVRPRPANPPAALIVGRLARDEDYKGHRDLIRAWPLVREHIPAAELWIAGGGDLQPDLEREAQRQGLGGAVRFWGRVSDETREELFQRCRCFAMPSRAEGFGLVYLEAMRWGRPCVVSTLDAGREVVNPPEAGLAVDPSEAEALAGALCQLLASGATWERASQQARFRYEQRFTGAHFQHRLVRALTEGTP